MMLSLSTAGFGSDIATWNFSDNKAVDTVSGLDVQASTASSGVEIRNGELILNNAMKADRDGVALVIKDNPILTGYHNGGSGYTSLVLKADVQLGQGGKQAQILRKTDNDIGYQLFLNKDNHIVFYIKTERGLLFLTSKNRITEDAQWHHIEAVWDQREWAYNAQLSVDGVVSWASAPAKMGPLTHTKGPLTIGGFFRAEGNIGQRLDGRIDNVQIEVDCPALFRVSGRIPTSGAPTGVHLLSQQGLLANDFIWKEAVTPECHAGTLAEGADGTIVAAWLGGTREGHVDSGIWSSTLQNGVWSQPSEIAHALYPNETLSASFNPVLFRYPDRQTLLLFYMGGRFDMSFLMASEDGGDSWGRSRRLPKGIRGASKNPPLLLADGTLICPDNDGKGMKFDRTRDAGETWLPSTTPPAGGIDAIQPAILHHADGRLQALARSHSGRIVQSWSDDQGATWSPVEETGLPNNYSGISATTLRDGRHMLVYNHVGIPKGKWGGARTPLNVAVSEDGVRWYAALVLEDEPGEFSYPTLIQGRDGIVHVIYTWKRLRMKHAEINPSKLVLREIKNGVWPH